MKKLVKATAILFAVICGMGLFLMKTEYWYIGSMAFMLAVGWFYAFFEANFGGNHGAHHTER
ncbi:MAG: hypothetical protein IKF99_00805 [Oscillospiraceae bacterium]|nr:hypothetical protein [Oscillospiraceae bacterium]